MGMGLRGVGARQGMAGRGGLPEEAERAGPGQGGHSEHERNPFQFLTQRPFGDSARHATPVKLAGVLHAFLSRSKEAADGLEVPSKKE